MGQGGNSSIAIVAQDRRPTRSQTPAAPKILAKSAPSGAPVPPGYQSSDDTQRQKNMDPRARNGIVNQTSTL